MRVIQLLRKLDPSEWSGTEMAIQRLVDGLREHAVEPVVFCPRLADGGLADPLADSGLKVQRFRAFVPVLGLSRQRRRQLVSVGGNLMSFELIPALWREPEVSLIHTHTLGRIGGIALTVAKQRRLPFVVTIHGGVLDLPAQVKRAFNAPLDQGWEWGKLFGLLFQSHRLFRDADAILTCNPNEAGLLQEQFPEKRVMVQPHGVPMGLYREDHRESARRAFPEICGRRVLLSFGRIDPIKNQGWLVEQAPLIFRKHPDTLLVLAGPCTDEAYGELIHRKIAELGLEDQVLLTGGLPPNDSRAIGLLQSAQVLLLPSVSETFGLVILEAWAAGTPVLAARTSGPAAMVRHGLNGWLFDLSDCRGFLQMLDRALADPNLCRQMARKGASISEQYSVNAIAAKVKGLYQELIEVKQCAT